MRWLTDRERLALTGLGALALIGLGVISWQQRRPAVRIEPGPPPAYAQWDALIQQARQVNLNTATVDELERLPEIGPVMAQRIIAYRTAHGSFRHPEELLDVPGIGPKTYEVLKDYVTVK